MSIARFSKVVEGMFFIVDFFDYFRLNLEIKLVYVGEESEERGGYLIVVFILFFYIKL